MLYERHTRNCILPWKYMLIHAGGLMQTCPCASDVEIGDFIIDYFEDNTEPDILNKKTLQMVREGLLSGNLRPMCRNCAFADPRMITIGELKRKLIDYLESAIDGYKYSAEDDLTKVSAYRTVGLSLSNKCNLRCLYCNQSTCADTNPFYKISYPEKYFRKTLDFFVKNGVKQIITSVEGEVTINPNWYRTFSEFLSDNPDIELTLTTNLNREYSDDEITLLARHAVLDISCDSLNPDIYSKLRVNGNLNLLLKNLEKIKNRIKELKSDCKVTIHVVVCNLTWESLPEISEFAFDNGFGLNLGNYEERANSLGYREGILKPIMQMPLEIQKQVSEILSDIRHRADELGLIEQGKFVIHGDIISRINKNVNSVRHRFTYTDNPIYLKYLENNELGMDDNRISIVYDDYNFAYEGIWIGKPQKLEINGIEDSCRVIVRKIAKYRNGHRSPKYGQTVAPGYRFIEEMNKGSLIINVDFNIEEIEGVLVEIKPI